MSDQKLQLEQYDSIVCQIVALTECELPDDMFKTGKEIYDMTQPMLESGLSRESAAEELGCMDKQYYLTWKKRVVDNYGHIIADVEQ